MMPGSSTATHHGLPTFARLEPRQLLGVLVDHVGELQEQLHPVLRRLQAPLSHAFSAAATARSTSSAPCPRHLGDHLAGRRVEHLHRLARDGSTNSPSMNILLLRHRNAHVLASRFGIAIRAERTTAVASACQREALTAAITVEPRAHEDPRRRDRRRRLGVRLDRRAALVLRPLRARRLRPGAAGGRRRPARRRPLHRRTRSTRRARTRRRPDPRDAAGRRPQRHRPASSTCRSSTPASRRA